MHSDEFWPTVVGDDFIESKVLDANGEPYRYKRKYEVGFKLNEHNKRRHNEAS